MKTSDFFYDLPQELIAQTPIEPRDASRLLVYNREDKQVTHKHFRDISDYLHAGDVLVVNDTRVIPARLFGVKPTGGAIEILLLNRKEQDVWEILCKPGRRAKKGTIITFGDCLQGEIIDETPQGGRVIRFKYEGLFEHILNELGTVPLPPYIREKLDDPERYQTVYARESGSAAAPTAGLHFTQELLEKIKEAGIQIAPVTLHVGLGTFLPVSADTIEEHHMHSEYYQITEETAQLINAARKTGGRVFSVGTTATRVLETVAVEDGTLAAASGWTDIFIRPGYRWKCVHCLITNFHLPESTLLMLVASLIGQDELMRIYNEAVAEQYRFFSFGDAMLIV